MNATIATQIKETRTAQIMERLGNRKTGWKYVGPATVMTHCGITNARCLTGAVITNAKAGLTLNVGIGAMKKYTDAKLPKVTKADLAAKKEQTIAKIKATKASKKVTAGAGQPAEALNVLRAETQARSLFASYQINPF